MNEGVQIHHYLGSAQYDLDSAFILIEQYRFGYSMALCGACLEKVLKALWIRKYHDHPPFRAPLLYLSKKLDLELEERQVQLLATFSLFCVEPEDIGHWKCLRRSINKEYVEKHLVLAEEFIEWVKPRLKK
jgi:HEPN domain-containing protein